MTNNTALKIEDLEVLFEALKPNSQKSLPNALEETIKIAKEKGISLEELQSSLDHYGIEGTEKFRNWLKNNF